MTTYLITGASRGIGLELVRQLLELPISQVGRIFALTRSSSSAALQALLDKNADRVVPIIASVDDTDSVRRAAEEVKTKLGAKGLDVLINNAATNGSYSSSTRMVPPEQMANVFDVNVIGPHRMILNFLPLLELGSQKKVINVSSTVGSILWADRTKSLPFHAYKISKTALNMLNAQYALDHADAGFTFLCVSPGWLRTELGGDQADLDVEVGVAELKRIVLESNRSQNGKFLDIRVPGYEASGQYAGGEVPW